MLRDGLLFLPPCGAGFLAASDGADPLVTFGVGALTLTGTIITLVITTRSNRRSEEAKLEATAATSAVTGYQKLTDSLMADLKLHKQDLSEQRKQIDLLRGLHEECERDRLQDRMENLARSVENTRQINELQALLQQRTQP